jgi:hypothetical protein
MARKKSTKITLPVIVEKSEDEISDYATRDIKINPAIGGASPGSGVATPEQ